MTRLSEQAVGERRQRLAVATTQASALAREVRRLRAEILSGEASDDGPDPRQLELPEVSPTPTPTPTPALAQAEPTRPLTLLERLTLAEPVRCLLVPLEEALSPGALALYRELCATGSVHDDRARVAELDPELVYELLAYELVTVVSDHGTGQIVSLLAPLKPEVAVEQPDDGEALDQLVRKLGETGTITELRDAARLPTVVVRAGLRALEQMGAVVVRGDEYVRSVRVPAVEAAILQALRLGCETKSALIRAITAPVALIHWSLAALHEAGVVLVREGVRVYVAPEPQTPLSCEEVDELVVGRLPNNCPDTVGGLASATTLSVPTTRDSLRRLLEAGVVQETKLRGSGEVAYEKAKASKSKSKSKSKASKAKASADDTSEGGES